MKSAEIFCFHKNSKTKSFKDYFFTGNSKSRIFSRLKSYLFALSLIVNKFVYVLEKRRKTRHFQRVSTLAKGISKHFSLFWSVQFLTVFSSTSIFYPLSYLSLDNLNPQKHIKKVPPRHDSLSGGYFFSVVYRKLL